MERAVPDQPTYGIAGACAYLHVSETSLRDLIASGELAASKPSQQYVIRKVVMDEYLAKLERMQTEQRKVAFEMGLKAVIPTAVSEVRRKGCRKRREYPKLPDLPKLT